MQKLLDKKEKKYDGILSFSRHFEFIYVETATMIILLKICQSYTMPLLENLLNFSDTMDLDFSVNDLSHSSVLIKFDDDKDFNIVGYSRESELTSRDEIIIRRIPRNNHDLYLSLSSPSSLSSSSVPNIEYTIEIDGWKPLSIREPFLSHKFPHISQVKKKKFYYYIGTILID